MTSESNFEHAKGYKKNHRKNYDNMTFISHDWVYFGARKLVLFLQFYAIF